MHPGRMANGSKRPHARRLHASRLDLDQETLDRVSGHAGGAVQLRVFMRRRRHDHQRGGQGLTVTASPVEPTGRSLIVLVETMPMLLVRSTTSHSFSLEGNTFSWALPSAPVTVL